MIFVCQEVQSGCIHLFIPDTTLVSIVITLKSMSSLFIPECRLSSSIPTAKLLAIHRRTSPLLRAKEVWVIECIASKQVLSRMQLVGTYLNKSPHPNSHLDTCDNRQKI